MTMKLLYEVILTIKKKKEIKSTYYTYYLYLANCLIFAK